MRLPSYGATPAFTLEQRLDTLANLLPNLADPSNGLASRILQGPVITFHTRDDWTLIATPHRDQHLRPLCELWGQSRCRSRGEIDSHLLHRDHHLRVHAATRIRAGRDRSCLARIHQEVEPRRRYLRPSGIVDAREQHGRH